MRRSYKFKQRISRDASSNEYKQFIQLNTGIAKRFNENNKSTNNPITHEFKLHNKKIEQTTINVKNTMHTYIKYGFFNRFLRSNCDLDICFVLCLPVSNDALLKNQNRM